MSQSSSKVHRRAYLKAYGIPYKDRPRDLRSPIERHHAAMSPRMPLVPESAVIDGEPVTTYRRIRYTPSLETVAQFEQGLNRSERRRARSVARREVRS